MKKTVPMLVRAQVTPQTRIFEHREMWLWFIDVENIATIWGLGIDCGVGALGETEIEPLIRSWFK